ncbi:hypothetical protein CBL_12026 [Carabus blaptoides fortunei]
MTDENKVVAQKHLIKCWHVMKTLEQVQEDFDPTSTSTSIYENDNDNELGNMLKTIQKEKSHLMKKHSSKPINMNIEMILNLFANERIPYTKKIFLNIGAKIALNIPKYLNWPWLP